MRIILLACLLCIALPAILFAADINPHEAAENAAKSVLSHLGDPDGLHQGISVPLTQEGSVLDPNKKTTSGLICPASEKFLSVTTSRDGFGRLVNTLISQDLDFDGVPDSTYQSLSPVPISGICRNGLFSCLNGGLDNCHYYLWQAESNGEVYLKKLDKEMDTGNAKARTFEVLGDCYCIANDCSKNFSAIYVESIMRDIGLGIVQAITKKRPRFVITEKSLNKSNLKDIEIIYRAKDISECKTSAAGSTASPENMSYTDIERAAREEIVAQEHDLGSYYNLVVMNPTSGGSLKEAHECTIIRQINKTRVRRCDPSEVRDGEYCYLNEADDYIILHKTGPKTRIGTDTGCFFSDKEPVQTSKTHMTIAVDRRLCEDPADYIVGNVRKAIRVTYLCGGKMKRIHGWEGDTLTITCPTGDLQFVEGYYYRSSVNQITCPIDYEGTDTLRCRRPLPPEVVISDEFIVDNCRTFATTCRLNKETSDGVETVREFFPTGLVPPGSCREIAGEATCRDFWMKIRRYECPRSIDFDEDLRRHGKTTDSVALKGDTFTYTSHTKDASGKEISENVSIKIVPYDPSPPCEASCKTKVKTVNTAVASETTRSGGRTTTDSREVKYYKCEKLRCPAPASETILVNCKCIDDFAEAATALKVIEELAQDADCDGDWKKNGSCAGKVTFFKGEKSTCHKVGKKSLVNCCTKDSGGNIIKLRCDDEDIKTWERNKAGLCHYVDDYCTETIWGSCVQRKKSYCCFHSKLARIIAEQGRPQLKAFGSQSWGEEDEPNCRGFTPEDLQQLDFSMIDISEYTADLTVDVPSKEEMMKNIKIP
jgi:hypothetical protein